MHENKKVKSRVCKYCGKEFICNEYTLINHIRRCDCNPNAKTIEENRKIKYTNTLNIRKTLSLGELKDFTVKCEHCCKEFIVTEYSNKFPTKSKYFCCKSHANAYSSSYANKTKFVHCIICGKDYEVNNRKNESNCICDNCKEARANARKLKKIGNKKKKQKLNSDKRNNTDTKNSNYHRNLYYANSEYQFNKLENNQCWVCGKFGCTDERCKRFNTQRVMTLIKYYKFDSTKLGTLEFYDELDKLKNELQYLYYDKKYSIIDISILYNCPNERTTYNLFKFLSIDRKSFSSAISNSIIQKTKERGSFYKTSWHTTWNNKLYYLRSSYENDFAQELDKNKIDYEVEFKNIEYFDTVKNVNRYAIPDFYLPDSNTVVEIKSTYTFDLQNMKDRVKSYRELGYNFKLILEHKDCTEMVL